MHICYQRMKIKQNFLIVVITVQVIPMKDKCILSFKILNLIKKSSLHFYCYKNIIY